MADETTVEAATQAIYDLDDPDLSWGEAHDCARAALAAIPEPATVGVVTR